MKFLYPEFLWALTVLAIPVIIHLFNFKRYKTLYFSSLSFIRHVDEQTKSTQRLKHILILISRILAFTFLVFAFAQPYFTDGTEKLNSKKGITCFYIDNSFSMQAVGPEGELLSEAREKAKEIIDKSPLDMRFLIGTNEMSGREERLLNRREALEKLDDIALCPLTRKLDQVIGWQDEALSKLTGEESKTKISHFLFSDFQKDQSEVIQLKRPNVIYYPTRLVPEHLKNVYVDSVWFSSPVRKTGSNNELNIRIVNLSEETIENLEVSIKIGEYDNTVFVNAPAKKPVETVVSYTDKQPGFKSGVITVSDENVFFDDSYFFSYEVQQFTNVLIVNGEDAIAGAHLIYEINDPYKASVKDLTAITKEDFAGKDLIVINGANSISSGLANYLTEFTESGGSVFLFPGRTPETSGWNQLLGALKLPGIGSGVSSGNRIKALNYEDPFYEGVFEEKTDQLNLPGVSRTFRALKSDSRSNDLITLQNGLPLLSYTKGTGNAFMFYSSVHEDFGNFSKDALFTTILLRAAELSKRKQPIALTIGSNSRYPVYEKINGDNAMHIKGNNADFIPQSSEVSGVTYLTLNKLDNYAQLLAGNYSIVSGEKTAGKISLNYNRSESQMNYLSEEEISKLFENNNFKYNEISSSSELSTSDIDKPFSYWKLCIIITIIFVATEMLLVRLLK